MASRRKIISSDDGVALSLEAMANTAGNAGDAHSSAAGLGPPREPIPSPANPDQEGGDPTPPPLREFPTRPHEDEPDDDPDAPEEDEPQIGAAGNAGDASADLHEQHQLAEMNAEVRYEARIQILDAWQYPGALKDAPGWIDRNWVAYAADEDQLRNIPAGPCLRVPLVSGEVAICRIGDFVAQQEIRLVPDQPGDIRVEVWPQEQFFKLFMPVHEKPFRPFMSGVTATIEHEPA